MKIADRGFYDSVRASRKIAVIVFGGLGDVVHAVPALRSIRLSFPDARIEAVAPAGWAPLLGAVDGLDRVVPNRHRKRGLAWDNLAEYWRLFRARYDLCINLWGSNHASMVALATLAPVRLGRKPLETWKRGWRLCHTHIADYPHLAEPMHAQWTGMLEQLGFKVDRRFALRVDPARFGASGIDPAWRGRYIHLSPSASEPAKELALPAMIEVAQALGRRLPEYPLVITTTAAPRHQQRLQALLAALERPPLAVLSGTLDVAALFAVIQEAALHVSADSGPVHMAVAAGTPSVSWFQRNPYLNEYLPSGPLHHAFVTEEPRAAGITSIGAEAIVEQCAGLLRRQQAAAAPAP